MQPSAVDDRSILEDFSVSTQPATSADAVGIRRKRRNVSTPSTPPASPSPSTSSSCSSILRKAMDTLQTSDRNSTFCDHLLSELRALPDIKALDLRRAVNTTMWNFLDKYHSEQAAISTIQLSPIQFVDEQGHNMNMKDVIVLQNDIIRPAPIPNVQHFAPAIQQNENTEVANYEEEELHQDNAKETLHQESPDY